MSQRVVFITGGSRGIGAACARRFAAGGGRGGLGYRQQEPPTCPHMEAMVIIRPAFRWMKWGSAARMV